MSENKKSKLDFQKMARESISEVATELVSESPEEPMPEMLKEEVIAVSPPRQPESPRNKEAAITAIKDLLSQTEQISELGKQVAEAKTRITTLEEAEGDDAELVALETRLLKLITLRLEKATA